jgi:hypothetical protein
MSFTITPNSPATHAGLVASVHPGVAAPSAPTALSAAQWTDRAAGGEPDIFKEMQQSHAKGSVSQAARQATQRATAAIMAQRLWGPAARQHLAAVMPALQALLKAQGVEALQQTLANHDPLERQALLGSLLEGMDAGDAQLTDLQAFADADERDNADALKGLGNAAGALASKGTAGSQTAGDVGALRQIFADFAPPAGSLREPLKSDGLASELLSRFGADGFESALKRLHDGALQDLKSPSQSPIGPRVLMAMADSSAFAMVREVVSLTRKFSQSAQTACTGLAAAAASDMVPGVLTLSAAGQSRAQDWATQLLGNTQADRLLASASGLSALRQLVESVPLSLWPSAALPNRLQLLGDIDTRQVATTPQRSESRALNLSPAAA